MYESGTMTVIQKEVATKNAMIQPTTLSVFMPGTP
jgi:hypothetical protein